ncbi:MAG: HNH endonuclease [Deltaproteobacteria bacterium]|nr:HNH endonuclease [Deltaproteobacteria bacterium]
MDGRKRTAVFDRDKYTCQYCGARAPEVELHVDHIIPCSFGGPSELFNLVTACQSCNLSKSNDISRNPDHMHFLSRERREKLRRCQVVLYEANDRWPRRLSIEEQSWLSFRGMRCYRDIESRDWLTQIRLAIAAELMLSEETLDDLATSADIDWIKFSYTEQERQQLRRLQVICYAHRMTWPRVLNAQEVLMLPDEQRSSYYHSMERVCATTTDDEHEDHAPKS